MGCLSRKGPAAHFLYGPLDLQLKPEVKELHHEESQCEHRG